MYNCHLLHVECILHVYDLFMSLFLPLVDHKLKSGVNLSAAAASRAGCREFEMIYRGPRFLAVAWFGSSTTPSPHYLPSASCLSFSVFLCVAGRAYWRERRVGGGDGAKSCDGEKAWSSINHSILSGWMFIYVQFVYENVSSALPLGPVDVLWESAQHNCHKQHNYVCFYVQNIHTSMYGR